VVLKRNEDKNIELLGHPVLCQDVTPLVFNYCRYSSVHNLKVIIELNFLKMLTSEMFTFPSYFSHEVSFALS